MAKKLKTKLLSINSLIESYFNKLRSLILNIKKTNFPKNNKAFLVIGGIVILTLSYFLIPTLYNKNLIQTEIENQIFKRYNFRVKFNNQINYGLLPKPHFKSKDLEIIRNKKKIANIKDLKIYISAKDFLAINQVDMKDLVFKNTDFNIGFEDIVFFKKLLKIEPNENELIIKNSNIFFKNDNEEILFINKIYKSKFFYDFVNFENTLIASNEIFNIPYKLTIKNDKFNKKIFQKMVAKKIRLNIQNEINYDKSTKEGILNILFINKNTSLNYDIKKNSLFYVSNDNKKSYKGNVDFKPFYFFSNFNYDGVSFKGLFNNESLLIDLIKTEIFNNKNLNANINFNVKDITNVNELNNLLLNIGIEQGNIDLSTSSVMWKDDLKISLSEGLLHNDEFNVNLIGKIIINFENLENFYRSFQVKKSNRKDIEEIEIDFVYNFDKKTITFDNVKIDKMPNLKLENFIDKFNKDEGNSFNKITFKNFISNFFNVYAG